MEIFEFAEDMTIVVSNRALSEVWEELEIWVIFVIGIVGNAPDVKSTTRVPRSLFFD
jgi:hypothetical protein